ncbi:MULTISPECIES: hypothetical protein [Rhodococcus]|uniref:Uncharacterized protein n=1 Tax=Rhodococcus opacus TaxID=37919 RepID=A0A2S8J1B3_RHOOP|nr:MULTISPECIES: hypothetical protein [Rhodococcus]PQP20860.1 hypothetical protein C5613_27205 [Rhodococcus opacus]
MRMLISAKLGVFPARGDGGGTAATTRTLPAAPPVSVGAVIKARIAAMVVGDRIRPGEVVLDVLGSVDSPPLGPRSAVRGRGPGGAGRGGAGRGGA